MYSDILKISDTSIFIAKKENSKIAIGVPHHTPSGTVSMPCESHPFSDENCGYIGAYIAEKLGCSFLCACNYFIDVNKNHEKNYSDYYNALNRIRPKYLIEIHGHGIEHSGNDIEISSGSSNAEMYALGLKDQLEKITQKQWKENKEDVDIMKIRELPINADFKSIYFKASKSATITDDRWISYHIELPTVLRVIPGIENKLPSHGIKFACILLEAIKNICT